MSFNIQNILKDVCEYKEASIRCLFVLCLTDVRCFKYVEVFKEAFEYTEGSKKCLCIYRSLQKRSLKTQKNLKYLCEYIPQVAIDRYSYNCRSQIGNKF